MRCASSFSIENRWLRERGSDIDSANEQAMMGIDMVTEEAVKQALRSVKYPGYSRDLVSFGLVKHIAIKDGAVSVTLSLTSSNAEVAQQIRSESESAVRAVPGVNSVFIEVTQAGGAAPAAAAGAQSPWSQQARVPGIQRIVAVASGKGGVGKSTVSVNLACASAAARAQRSGCSIAISTAPSFR